jgi:uncharacterized protein YdhG (YjbR/CyaY superfamily)
MKKFSTVDEYINAQPVEVAKRLTAIRHLFKRVLPDTKESIRYQIPAFTVGDYYLYISGYKHHIGMYPAYGILELEDELLPYKGKGTKDSLHFKHSEPLPLDLIEKIIIAKSQR